MRKVNFSIHPCRSRPLFPWLISSPSRLFPFQFILVRSRSTLASLSLPIFRSHPPFLPSLPDHPLAVAHEEVREDLELADRGASHRRRPHLPRYPQHPLLHHLRSSLIQGRQHLGRSLLQEIADAHVGSFQ